MARKKSGAKVSTAEKSPKSKAKSVGSGSHLTTEKLTALMQLMNQHGVGVLEFENADERWHLELKGNVKQGAYAIAADYPAPPTSGLTHAAPQSPASVSTSALSSSASKQKQILSPFVGTFYRSPNPNAEAYVREGTVVKQGDTLCIVEAMKLMNEIESEFSGKIVSILVENGQPVEFGEPLFLIET